MAAWKRQETQTSGFLQRSKLLLKRCSSAAGVDLHTESTSADTPPMLLVCFGHQRRQVTSGGAAHFSTVGGLRGQRHQVERDLPQRRLTGQRPQQADGVLDGDDLLHLLLRPRQRDLRREPVSGQENVPERAVNAPPRWAWAHLHDDQFGGHVVSGAQLLAETQRDAALGGLAAVGVKVLQLWVVEKNQNTDLFWDLTRFLLISTDKKFKTFPRNVFFFQNS